MGRTSLAGAGNKAGSAAVPIFAWMAAGGDAGKWIEAFCKPPVARKTENRNSRLKIRLKH